MKRLVIVATMAGCLGAFAFGQTANAVLTGTAVDSSGALIPGVEVTATNVETGVTTTGVSNETGAYRIGSLLPGVYTVRAELPGFRVQTFTDVRLGSGVTVRVNFALQVGGLTETVEVTASAATLLLESSPSVGGVLQQSQIQSIPVISAAGAEALDLTRTLPGVQIATDPINNGDRTLLAGVSAAFAQVQRDGVDAGGAGRWSAGLVGATVVNPDMVGEIRTTLSPVDAAVGRGNSQIQMRTRSGTNQFHGAGVWSFGNSAFEPNGWENNRLGQQGLWFNDHQLTGSLGGPIVKDRTHFFVLFDYLKPNSRSLVNNTVLTPCAQRGIFRYYDGWNNGNAQQVLAPGATPTIAVVNANGSPVAPATNPNGTPFNGALRYASVFGQLQNIPTKADCSDAIVTGNPWDPNRTQIDPSGYISRVLQVMPTANNYDIGDGLNSAGYRFVRGQTGILNRFGIDATSLRKQINFRIDHKLNSRHTVGTSYTYETNFASYSLPLWGPPKQSGFTGGSFRQPQVMSVNFTSTLSRALLNEARFGMRRTGTNSYHAFSQRADPEERKKALDWYPNINNMPVFLQPGGNNIGCCTGGQPGGHTATGGAFHADVIENTRLFTLGDTLSWTRGRHTLQFGGEYRKDATGLGIDVIGNDFSTYSRAFGGETTLTPVQGITSANIAGLAGTTTTGNNLRMRELLNLLSGSVSRVTELFWLGSGDQAGKWDSYQNSPVRTRVLRRNDLSWFAKDDWQATPNLTLNLGIRWDYFGVPWLDGGLTPVLAGGGRSLFGLSGNSFADWMRPGLRGALTQLQLGGPGSRNPDLRPMPKLYGNFGPAIGFAWQVPWFGAGQTTLRGGYQLTYLEQRLGTYDSAFSDAPGTSYQYTFDGGPGLEYIDLSKLSRIVPNNAPPVAPLANIPVTARNVSLSAFDPNYKTAYTQNLTLAITRNVTKSLVMDVRYVGTLSRKLYGTINLNAPNFLYNGLKEAFDAARAGEESPLLDQMFKGINIAGTGFGPVGTVVNGVLQTGAMQLRNSAAATTGATGALAGSIQSNLANGNYLAVANTLNTLNYNASFNPGLAPIPAGVNGAVLRYSGLPENFIKANPQFDNANLLTNPGSTNYHSLQTQATLRPTAGVSLQGTYTWSKSLGQACTSPGAVCTAFTNPADRSNPSDYILQSNRAHDFRLNGTFGLPFGPGRFLFRNSTGLIARLTENWDLTWLYNAATGLPASIIGQTTLYANGTPDVVGPFDPKSAHVTWPEGARFGTYLGSGLTQVKDPQCASVTTKDGLQARCTLNAIADPNGTIILQNAKPGTRGTLGQGVIEMPGIWKFDLSLSKKIKVRENKSVSFRAEALNVLNNPPPSDPNLNMNTIVGGASFNQTITKGALMTGGQTQFSGDGKRIIKINLRFDF